MLHRLDALTSADAEAVERDRKDELKREFETARRVEKAPMTLDEAWGRYWDEKGQYANRAAKSCGRPGTS